MPLKGAQPPPRPVPNVEIEMYVDWDHPISVEDPSGGYRPPVVLRMPAYMAALLAHLLNRFDLVRSIIGSGVLGTAPFRAAAIGASGGDGAAAAADADPNGTSAWSDDAWGEGGWGDGGWGKVAPALLSHARLAAGEDRYPELADLAFTPPGISLGYADA